MTSVLLLLLTWFAALNMVMLAQVLIAAGGVWRAKASAEFVADAALLNRTMTPGISLIMPVPAVCADVTSSVRAMLALRYPTHEVVVVVDPDGPAFAELSSAFGLMPLPRSLPADIARAPEATGVWISGATRLPLQVVGCSDTTRAARLNLGVNAARQPLVLAVDPGVALEADALPILARPFVDDPAIVVASAAAARVRNGAEVIAGRVATVTLPADLPVLVQLVDRLQSWLVGRVGSSRETALSTVSGATVLYRRDTVVDFDGFDAAAPDLDLDLLARIHAYLAPRAHPFRAVAVADPVSWVEVAASRGLLEADIGRWQRARLHMARAQSRMTFNPQYGRAGLLALPSFWMLGVVAPVIELAAPVLVVAGVVSGAERYTFAVCFVLVAYVYPMFVSFFALLVGSSAPRPFHEFTTSRDLARGVLACAALHLGHRQRVAWWQLRALRQLS